ncbi:unnamed protein product [Ilex paraguariensis]|uniref:DUF4220 domain-containing protein n=1 Tax=Ilex paraguariensis TaxID=185542 RepID=A0ABC8QYI0_9AQUA
MVSFKEFLSEWQLRGSFLGSLLIQVLLILPGNIRKRNSSICVTVFLWILYTAADKVAIYAISIVSRSITDPFLPHNRVLVSFWTTILLLHLGFPNTITAFSLDDNQLWLRQSLTLVTQVGFVVYILLRALWGITQRLVLVFAIVCVSMAGLLNYTDMVATYSSTINAGIPAHWKQQQPKSATTADDKNNSDPQIQTLTNAYDLFMTFRRLFVNLILTFDDRDKSLSIFRGKDAAAAFEMVGIELNFAYDALYTKAFVSQSSWLHHSGSALALEIASLAVFIVSDWTVVLSSSSTSKVNLKWLEQPIFSILSFVRNPILRLPSRPNSRNAESGEAKRYRWNLTDWRGKMAILDTSCPELKWIIELEFDECLLLWHVATDICYHQPQESMNSGHQGYREASKLISCYMMYLLVVHPLTLSSTAVIGLIRFRDTCAELIQFFKDDELIGKEPGIGSENLLFMHTDLSPKRVKGDKSKSVLWDAVELAKELMELDEEKMWKTMCDVWIEMLCFAAYNCRGDYHAKLLSVGGELLTFVWLLQAHLGMGDYFQTKSGNLTATIILES